MPPGVSVVKLEVVAVPGFAVVGQRVSAVILEVVVAMVVAVDSLEVYRDTGNCCCCSTGLYC